MPNDEEAIPISSDDQQEAVRRIQECKETGQSWLDLSGLDLEELPDKLGELTWLRHLALGGRGLKVVDGDRIERGERRPWILWGYY